MTPDEEARLIARARRGDARAFASLVDANQQAVRGFLRRYCGHWGEADDLAQEAFLMAWRRLDRFEGRARFRTWVSGIGYRISRDARRARLRADVRDAAWGKEQESQTTDASAVDDAIAVNDAMATLPEDQRACVALCLGEGFSHAEAAEALGMPLGTVKSHVLRGRERLLRALGGEP